MAIGTASDSAMICENSTSSSVTQMRCASASATGCPVRYDTPRSPCTASPNQLHVANGQRVVEAELLPGGRTLSASVAFGPRTDGDDVARQEADHGRRTRTVTANSTATSRSSRDQQRASLLEPDVLEEEQLAADGLARRAVGQVKSATPCTLGG